MSRGAQNALWRNKPYPLGVRGGCHNGYNLRQLMSSTPRHRAPRSALTARWTNLVLATYEVSETILRRHLHPSLELDRWEDRCHVSLVAFDFEQTRVLGMRIPFFESFPEVNLRTYVRFGEQRGVAFIREFVPSRLIATIARLWYNEPYRSVPLSSRSRRTNDTIQVSRTWKAGNRTHSMDVSSTGQAFLPAHDSLEHHFKEHEWGFGSTRSGRLLRYRVEHPVWLVRPITASEIAVGFRESYGNEWSPLDERAPMSLIVAEGSPVRIYWPDIQ